METLSTKKLRTYPTGTFISLADISVNDIHIEDIAHALSMQCRFGGHVKDFYSVAEHCTRGLARIAQDEKTIMLQWLLHDAAEAYLIDLPGPAKDLLPEYKKLEEKIAAVIAAKFGIPYPMCEEVKYCDAAMKTWEFENIVLDRTFHPQSPWEAKNEFLSWFKRLTNEKY